MAPHVDELAGLPMRVAHFDYDTAELSARRARALDANAAT
jgi:hypothetical protein